MALQEAIVAEGVPPITPQLLQEGADMLRELQRTLANLGRDERRKLPEFQELMAQYKIMGAQLHGARQRVPPPPPPVKREIPPPRSVTALGQARAVRPVAPQAGGISALSRGAHAYGTAPPAARPTVAPQPAAPAEQDSFTPAPAPVPVADPVAAAVPRPEPIPEPVEYVRPPAEALPLPLPKFTGTLGPPGSKCIDAGPPVANLQRLLVALGYDIDQTGHYDVRTFRAVQELQKERKIGVTGIIGLDTRKLLNEMVTG